MHGEVVHPLFALLNEGVPVNLPGEFLGLAADFFQGLVNRHRADRHGGIANNPFPRFMNVPAGGKVHHRVGAPLGCPPHFLDLLFDAGGHRAVADVRVDFDEEIAADDHRLALRVIDVGGNDGPSSGHLVTHEFGRDELGDAGAKGFAAQGAPTVAAGLRIKPLAAQVLANRDEFHLGRDHSLAGILHLGHHPAGLGPQGLPAERGRDCSVAPPGDGTVRRLDGLDVSPRQNPVPAQGGKPLLDGALIGLVPPRAAGVIDPDRRVFLGFARGQLGGAEPDFAEGNAQVGVNAAGDIHAGGVGERRAAVRLGNIVFGNHNITAERVSGADTGHWGSGGSLRQHYLDQVQRVCGETARHTLSLRTACFRIM